MPAARTSESYQAEIQALSQKLVEKELHIVKLKTALIKLRDCDWVVTWADRMDAVRDIAKEALDVN